jgi:imidazolonepropionase
MGVLRNIAELIVVPSGPVGGRSMRAARRIPQAAVVFEGGRLTWFGPETELPPGGDRETMDAGGGCVVPGLVDCHTHAVFAGTREQEFVARIEGKSYAQIAEEGGGIRVTVEAVRAAARDRLLSLALPRLRRMLANGVTTVEIKSGYGLTVADEIKMLEVIRRLGECQPIELVATYLAAHVTPTEFAGRPDAYLDVVLDDGVLGELRDRRLAEFCDVFCDRTAFDVPQSRRVLRTAQRHGLRPKIHADQLSRIGASALAGEVGAVSADHLEHVDDRGVEAMQRAGTVPVLLPGCSFFLGVGQAPARRLLDADLPVAIATDYNPGSSMMESLPLVMNLACTQMRMRPLEVLIAATANAAAALCRADQIGAIEVGRRADLVILDVPNLERWLYEPGRNCVRGVVKGGEKVYWRDEPFFAPEYA